MLPEYCHPEDIEKRPRGFVEFPPRFFELITARVLDVSNTGIEELPENLLPPCVQTICMDHNYLTKIPRRKGGFRNDKNIGLSVADNKIKEVPEDIRYGDYPGNLNVADNEIRNLPKWVGNLDTVYNMNLEGNPLSPEAEEVLKTRGVKCDPRWWDPSLSH